MNTLLGTKTQQMQGFLENGTRVPLTLVVASENVIISQKTTDKEKYNAITLGFGKTKKSTKALFGQAKKAGLSYAPRSLKEVKVDDVSSFEAGKVVAVDEVFKPGDIVDVQGTSKGKGFAGGVKRYNFRGGPKTHGQSDRHRAPGSIGSGTTPGRVYKGKRMAGNMGNDTVTVKNLVVIDVDTAKSTLLIKGLVPGIIGGTVVVTKVGEVKEKNFVPLYKATSETPTDEASVEEVQEQVEPQEVVAEAAAVEEAKVEEVAVEESPKEEEQKAEEVKEENNG